MRIVLALLCALLAVAPGNGGGNNGAKGRSVSKAKGKKLDGCYGVKFSKEASETTKQNTKSKSGKGPSREWSNGFQVCGITEETAASLLEDDLVLDVFEDGVVYKLGATDVWGLDRIDSLDGELDNNYATPGAQGAGVTVYVLDTCGDASHPDFGGRAEYIDVADQYPDDEFTDACCDHGTHCMGTVGSNTYGVAKQVTLKSIRVLSCAGSGSYTSIIAAIDWVVQNHYSAPDGNNRAIISMSLGGPGTNSGMLTAIDNARAAGIITVVAGGNDAADSCAYSPAFVPSAITVSATDRNDALASFSNWGTCVDINAPGVDICSTYPSNAVACWAGTSMACPHVAGALALLLSNQPTLSVDEAEAKLINAATPSISTTPAGHTSLLLNVVELNSAACEIVGCTNCPDTSVCQACRAGYRLVGGRCSPCTVSDCASCDSAEDICTSCSAPFSLVSNECIRCPDNCAVCTGPNTCTTCDVGYFSTAQGLCARLCSSYANSALDSIVQRFQFGNMEETSNSCSVYRLSSSTVSVTRGGTVPMSLVQGTCSGNYRKISAVYIDWNANGLFEASERVSLGVYQSETYTVNTDIQIPPDAHIGPVHGRAIVSESSSIAPCGTYQWGETLDFMVHVIEPGCAVNGDCTAPNACTISSCVDGQCAETRLPACCLSDMECTNDITCMATSCQNNQCVANAIPGCCTSHADCPASSTVCFEPTCGANNFCSETRICDCCEQDSDCDDGDATTHDECKMNGADGQCYHTPVDCQNIMDGTCWFVASIEQSCEAKCSAEGRTVSTKTTSFAGSSGSDSNCLAVAQLFDPSADFSRTSAHARGCVFTAGAVVRGTAETLLDSSCSSEERICACDSVSAVTGTTLALVGGGIALLAAGILGGVVIQKKRKSEASGNTDLTKMQRTGSTGEEQHPNSLAVSVHTTDE